MASASEMRGGVVRWPTIHAACAVRLLVNTKPRRGVAMSQRTKILTEILGYRGWKVQEVAYERPDGTPVTPLRGVVPEEAMVVCRVRRWWSPRCMACGALGAKIHQRLPSRRWRDLPWAEHPAVIEYAPLRLDCRRCGSRGVEWLAWALPSQRQTDRLQQQLALCAASMPVSHVAAMYGLDWGTVQRAERQALERWDKTRTPPPLRHVGIDEKYLGRRNKLPYDFVTIVSNVETGEPLWIGPGRSEETVCAWLATLTSADKARLELAVMDMHAPFANAIRNDPALGHVAIVHDPFHVMKRAAQAVDEMRRAAFFRAGPELRRLGRGTRWLVLRAWEKCSAEDQTRLRELFSQNRHLARAYQLVEELRAVLHAPDRASMAEGFERILRRTERRNNIPLRKLHDSLAAHREAILALGEFRPAAGRVEALNTTWESLSRRGRGYRDHAAMLLKLRFMIANPIRRENGVRRFLALGMQPPPRRAAA
jgi:transposase